MKMKTIGKGQFSTVLEENKKTVLIVSICPIKYIYANSSNSLFPRIEVINENIVGRVRFRVYRAEKLERFCFQKLSETDRNFYRILRKLKQSINSASILLHRVEEMIKKEKDRSLKHKFKLLAKQIRDIFEEIYQQDVYFEISPRNVMMRGNRMILNDIFFSSETFSRKREQRKLFNMGIRNQIKLLELK